MRESSSVRDLFFRCLSWSKKDFYVFLVVYLTFPSCLHDFLCRRMTSHETKKKMRFPPLSLLTSLHHSHIRTLSVVLHTFHLLLNLKSRCRCHSLLKLSVLVQDVFLISISLSSMAVIVIRLQLWPQQPFSTCYFSRGASPGKPEDSRILSTNKRLPKSWAGLSFQLMSRS